MFEIADPIVCRYFLLSPGPKVISCSTQLSMEFQLLIKTKNAEK